MASLTVNSGYDFGYLLKLVSCAPLPATEDEFFELLKIWFPCIYDIKFLMRSCKSLKGGLQDVADELQVQRIGPQHQAGSDSLLTLNAFFKMRQKYFEDEIDDKYLGNLYGLGSSNTFVHTAYSSTTPQILSNNATTPNSAPPGSTSSALQIKDPLGVY